MLSMLVTDILTSPDEDVTVLEEPATWLCARVVMAAVCVNVTVGNPECILDALSMSSVILGVAGVDGTTV